MGAGNFESEIPSLVFGFSPVAQVETMNCSFLIVTLQRDIFPSNECFEIMIVEMVFDMLLSMADGYNWWR